MADNTQKMEYFGASKKEMMAISLVQVATNLFNVVMMMATYMATGGWGLTMMFASQVAAAMRIFDGITDPIIAWFVPRVRTKIGVGTPVVILGWIMEFISILLLFNGGVASTKSPLIYILLYSLHVIGYTLLNKGIGIYKLNVTNNPKVRPMFQRYSQTIFMVATMLLSLYRADYLVPKYGGLKPGAFAELSVTMLAITTVLMIVSIYFARRYDDAESFERNYHGATKFNLKDIWNLVVHNRAFLTEIISQATDKIAQQTVSNAAVQTLLFGIVIANYQFSGKISIVTTAINLFMIWSVTGRAGRKGARDAYVKLCWFAIGISAVTCVFMASIDPTTITVSVVPTVIFVVLYAIMSSMSSSASALTNTLALDIQDYELYLHGKYLGPMVASVGSILAKTVDSFSNIIIAYALTTAGYAGSEMPQPGDATTTTIFWITMFLWLGMPVLGYGASILAMKFYPLNAEKMEEVQRHNAELRARNAAQYDAEKAAKKG